MIRRNPGFFILLCISYLLINVTSALSQEDGIDNSWTRFRGHNGLGVFSIEQQQQAVVDTSPRWKVALAGVGNGSPVLYSDRVFVQSADTKTGAQYLQCFQTDGKLLWQREFTGHPHKTHAWGSLASSTPTVDAHRVYACWGGPEQTALTALTHEGDLLWQIDLGPNRFEHGFGSSPTLIDEKLIFFHSQDATTDETAEPKNSRVLALDPATGKQIWETPMRKDTRVCYGVPVETKLADGRIGILAADTGHGIFCLDCETGRLEWETPVVKQRAVAGVTVVGDLALASSGSGGGGNQLVAVRITDQSEAYRISRNANYVPMPIVVAGHLFVPNDKGILSCCVPETGETLHQRRMSEGRFNISVSLVAIGDRLIVCSDEGQVRVVSANEEMSDLQEFSLGEGTRATPAISKSQIVFRTDSHLHGYSYDVQQTK